MNAAEFQGQTFIISGGATGLGASISQAFAASGATVYTLDHQVPAFPAIPNLHPILCDLTDINAIDNAIQTITTQTSVIHGFIANAGIQLLASIEDTPIAALQQLFQLNVEATYCLLQAFLPLMQQQGYGRIVLMGSEQALIGRPYGSAYAMSKAALLQFVRNLSSEYGQYNILSNCLCPSSIEGTAMNQQAAEFFAKIGLQSTETVIESFACEHLSNRLITQEEIVYWIQCLCSPRNRSMTGQALVIDSGISTVR